MWLDVPPKTESKKTWIWKRLIACSKHDNHFELNILGVCVKGGGVKWIEHSYELHIQEENGYGLNLDLLSILY